MSPVTVRKASRPVSPTVSASSGWDDEPIRVVAIDVGTSTVRIGTTDRVVVDEPSVVARDGYGTVFAVGGEVRSLTGLLSPSTDVVEPIDEATIIDPRVTGTMLRRLLSRGGVTSHSALRAVVVSVPVHLSGNAERAMRSCVQQAAPNAAIVPLRAPYAAAVGAGLPVDQASAVMVVDVGRGVTEAAVIANERMLSTWSAPVGGATAAAAVVAHLRRVHALDVDAQTAERVIRFSSRSRRGVVVCRGTRPGTEVPGVVQMSAAECRAMLRPVVASIAAVAKEVLARTPSSAAADVALGTIVLTGGASRLSGLGYEVSAATGVAVRVRGQPGHAVIDGARRRAIDLAVGGLA